MSDLISRADAIEAVVCHIWHTPPETKKLFNCENYVRDIVEEALERLPSAEATKKKAELKDNGDWDCPDVDCDECDHHRSVEWCSLAIPNHEEKIDETYKMVNEAFFEGFNMAEKRYRLLIETIEELDEKLAEAVEVVHCKDCKWWQNNIGYSVSYCPYDDNIGTPDADDYCSYGERKKENEI